MISTIEIAWAAGFLEGEGGFVCGQRRSAFTISAVQLQREPLERLQRLFGGHLKGYVNKRGTLVHRWTVNGAHAVSVGFVIFSFMSVKRKAQIVRIVEQWKACPGLNNRWKTHCPKGHEYGERSTCTYNYRRYCTTCYPSYAHLIEADREEKSRALRLKTVKLPHTHCPRGHAYEGDNLGFNSHTKSRYCRTCENARRRKGTIQATEATEEDLIH